MGTGSSTPKKTETETSKPKNTETVAQGRAGNRILRRSNTESSRDCPSAQPSPNTCYDGEAQLIAPPWMVPPCSDGIAPYVEWSEADESTLSDGTSWSAKSCKQACDALGNTCAGYAYGKSSSSDSVANTCTTISMTCDEPTKGIFRGNFRMFPEKTSTSAAI